ncbi:MAG: DUF4843 domain-containing protein [Runella sp.]
MKNIFKLSLWVMLVASLTSCFENPNLIYNGPTVVEFATAVTTAPAAGRTFPLLTVSNGAGIQRARLNLVGPQAPVDRSIRVVVDAPNTTAVAGTHFRLVNSTVTIPANSSFGDVEIEILRVPAQTGASVNVVLLLEAISDDVKPSENFKRLGWTIRL